jgi:HD superfamily phosphohydrolase
VHDEIVVADPWLWGLINTRAMQRLRRIRQLGTSYFTFHGAEHSRFTHSLGAYETMRRVLAYLGQDHNWPKDERERKLALAAALLHDIGHGPFSHTFESVYTERHEYWTTRILMEDSEIHSLLDQQDECFAQDLVDIFARKGRFPYVQQLISSQLDVDRMDYLLRDALHTGVNYGRFELGRLIRSITLAGGQVLLKLDGIHTAEQYILARYFMYTQVYLHPITIGSDLLVAQVLHRAEELWRMGKILESPRELPVLWELGSKMKIEDYLSLDESTLIYAFHLWSHCEDPVLKDLASRFLERRLYTPVVQNEPTSEEWAELRTAAALAGYHPDYYVLGRRMEVAGYVYQGEGIPVLLPRGGISELSRESRLVRSLIPDSEYRVFLPKDLLEDPGLAGQRVRTILKLS